MYPGNGPLEMTDQHPTTPIENRHLNETMRFSAYSVRNVVLQDSYPLDAAQFRDLTSKQPALSIIASALTGGAIAWGATLLGKYLDPHSSPERWEELALVALVIGASVFHTLAGTFANKNKKKLLKEIESHFKIHPREVMSINSEERGRDDGHK
jgi:hypothetical protein